MLFGNSLAHLTGRLVTLATGIVTIPLVTMTLGTEALGLVGVYTTLLTLFAVFDLGLPMVVNHRIATMIERRATDRDRAVTVRTLEAFFIGQTVLFLGIGLLLHRLVATQWLKPAAMAPAVVEAALVLMIVTAAVRFPIAFYSNVLFAHDRHLYPNLVAAISALLRLAVALVLLITHEIGIVGYFVVNLVGSVAETLLVAVGAWLTQSHFWVSPRLEVLRAIAGMTGGLTAVSLGSIALSQIDKIVLSKFLPLGEFGVYTAGYALAAGLAALSYPVGNAAFPGFSRGLAGKNPDVAVLLQASAELTVLMLVPLACLVITQPAPLLTVLFLGRPFPELLATLLPVMMVGGLALGLATLPHLFGVAAGRPAIIARMNLACIVPYALAVYAGALSWGVLGAAAAFAVLHVVRLPIHWTALGLSSEARAAWRSAIIVTVKVVAAGFVLSWLVLPIFAAGGASIASVAIALLLLLATTVAMLPILRGQLARLLRARFGSLRDLGGA